MKRGARVATSGLIASLVLASACSAPSKGSLVLAISTDMQTPKDIDVVSLFVTEGSVVKFDYLGHVLPEGTVALPATLALVEPDDPSTPIQIRILGFNGQTARVLRDIQTTVPHERTSLLRVPLDFIDVGSVGAGVDKIPDQYFPTATDGVAEGLSSFDPRIIASACDPHELCRTPGASCMTTVNGACQPATVDPNQLPPYTAQGVFGGDGSVLASGTPGSCFDVETCFADAAPISAVTSVACSFPFPGGASPATLNVGLVTPKTGACVGPGQCYVPLPEDPNEGWSLQGNDVQLAPGVCQLLGSSVSVVVSSGACPTLTLSQPVCEPTGPDAATSAPDAEATDGEADDAALDDATPTEDAGGPAPEAAAPTDASTADAPVRAAEASAPPLDATTMSTPDATAAPDGSSTGVCLAPPGGIVSWWTGDGTLADLEGVNPGSANGNVGFTTGIVGQAFLFNGGGAYVSAGNGGLPIGSADRTIELWARVDAVPSAVALFAGYGSWGISDATNELYVQGTQLGFSQWGQNLPASQPATLSAWTHLAVTYTDGQETLYVNGMVAGTGTLPIETPSSASTFIGGVASAPDGNESLTGAVDEVTIYDRALAATEIAAINAAGSAGKCKTGVGPGDASPPAMDAAAAEDGDVTTDATTMKGADSSTALQCIGGTTACDTACVDLQTDSNNCGSCGFVCSAEYVCESATCTAPDGDVATDASTVVVGAESGTALE